MEKAKQKITAEIPMYLKKWIDAHDVSQNALVTLALRKLYNEDVKQVSEVFMQNLLQQLSQQKLPF